MSVRRAVATLIALQILYAGFGVVSAEFGMHESAVFTVWAILGLGQLAIIRRVAQSYARATQPQEA